MAKRHAYKLQVLCKEHIMTEPTLLKRKRSVVRRILVAADLSKKDENIFSRALEIARKHEAQLYIMHVHHAVRVHQSSAEYKEEKFKEISAHITSLLCGCGYTEDVNVITRVVDGGRIYDRINSYALDKNVDLIIMGASQLNVYVPDFVLTTVEKVIACANCPVLIVSQSVKSGYQSIAVYASKCFDLMRTLDILPLAPKGLGGHIHHYTQPIPSRVGVLSGLRHKFELRAKAKENRFIRALYSRNYSCVQYEKVALGILLSSLLSLNLDVLSLTLPKNSLCRQDPDKGVRGLLSEPDCDILILGSAAG